jgi:carboxylesterase type B
MYPLDAMAAQGVVAVSMNFRLGRLGYFAHPALAAEAPSAYWVSFGQSGDPNGGGRPTWPRHDSAVNRLLHFTNSGIIVGTDPLKPRLDLWQRVWERLPPP